MAYVERLRWKAISGGATSSFGLLKIHLVIEPFDERVIINGSTTKNPCEFQVTYDSVSAAMRWLDEFIERNAIRY